MNHEEGMGMIEEEKADWYPPTIWSELREELFPWVFLVGLAVTIVGLIFRQRDIATAGLIFDGVAMVVLAAAIVFEYRADMRHDRQRGDESEVR